MFKWLKNLFSRTPDTPAPASKPSGKSSASGKSAHSGKPQASDKARPSGKAGSSQKPKGAGKQQSSGKATEPKKSASASKPSVAREPEEKEETLHPDEFIWCLVGNIVTLETQDTPSDETEESAQSQKQHFSAHTKVYCFPPKWTEGNQRCKVIGRHRKSKRHICVVMSADQITNWRMEKVQKPYVVKMMQRQKGWSDTDADKEKIEALLAQLPNAQV